MFVIFKRILHPACTAVENTPSRVHTHSMPHDPFQCFLTLAQEQDFGRAARRSQLSRLQLHATLAELEQEFGPLVYRRGPVFAGLTAAGESLRTWAQRFDDECKKLRQTLQTTQRDAALAPLLERRSVSPKRLHGPGPSAQDIDLILQAALRAPDHGGLHPWRVLEFRAPHRTALADLFEEEKRRRDPLASAGDLQRAREHATRAPALLAFVVSPKVRSKIPAREQWLAAGAALGNLLNAAHQLGFGAIVLSGERCYDPTFTAGLGIQGDEFLAGFVSLGSIAQAPPSKDPALSGEVWSCWMPGVGDVPAVKTRNKGTTESS